MLFLPSSFPGNDPRWVYDDPSGVDETPAPDRSLAPRGSALPVRRPFRRSVAGTVS
ncbi:MAG: hypothetical protein ACYDCH_03370 [Gaiellaceae bacterium]